MYLLNRDFVCERLRLNLRQSYRIVGSSRSGLISSDEILRIVNRSRRGIAEPYSYIPSDIKTAEELVAAPELALSGLSPSRVIVWTKRTKNMPPHFRYNNHTRRFPLALFVKWLDANSKIGRLS